MNLDTPSSYTIVDDAPFRGWNDFIADCRSLGPAPLLRGLMRAATVQAAQAEGFGGTPLHNPLSYSVLSQVLVGLLVTEHELLARADEACLQTAADKAVFIRLLQDANALALAKPHREDVRMRVAETFNRGAVIQAPYTAYRPENEVARTWLAVNSRWPQALERASREIVVPGEPLKTAFDCLEYAFAIELLLRASAGWQPDPAAAVAGTALAEHLELVLNLYVPNAGDVVGTLDEIKARIESGAASPFMQAPVVQLEGTILLAPEPSLLIAGADLRATQRILTGLELSEREQRLVSTAGGYVHEAHVQHLVRVLGEPGDREYVDEFAYGDGGPLSPDANLLTPGPILFFEAKVTRIPPVFTFEAVLEWLEKLAGKRPDPPRGPFEQIGPFCKAWQEGDTSIKDRLRRPYSPPGTGWLYVIVSYDQVPLWLSSRLFNTLWRDTLPEAVRPIAAATRFVSIRDLEYLAACSESRGADPRQVLIDWHASNANAMMPISLGHYLAEMFGNGPEQARPTFMVKPARDAFQEAARRYFPEFHIEGDSGA